MVLLGSRLGVSYRTPLSGCAYDGGTGGALGLYRWSERMGLPTTLLEVPIGEAPGALHEPSGNVLVTMGDGPWSRSGDEAESSNWQVLEGWLARGNALIVVTGRPESLPEEILSRLRGDDRRQLTPSLPPVPPHPSSLPPARSVETRPETVELPVTGGGGSLTVEAQGPRWSQAVPDAQPGSPATGSTPRKLAGDDRGGVLYRIPVGEGAFYVLFDSFAWSNAGLDSARIPNPRPPRADYNAGQYRRHQAVPDPLGADLRLPRWEDAVDVTLSDEIEESFFDYFNNRSGTKLGGWPSLIQAGCGFAPPVTGLEHPALAGVYDSAPEFAFQGRLTAKSKFSDAAKSSTSAEAG